MHWMIKCRSKPGTDELRNATIPAHVAHLDKYREETWFSGPIFTDDGTSAIGSLRFIEFADRAAARAYIDADPYTTEGIFESINIQRWQPALEHRQLTYPRQDGTEQFIVHCTDVAGSDALSEDDLGGGVRVAPYYGAAGGPIICDRGLLNGAFAELSFSLTVAG